MRGCDYQALAAYLLLTLARRTNNILYHDVNKISSLIVAGMLFKSFQGCGLKLNRFFQKKNAHTTSKRAHIIIYYLFYFIFFTFYFFQIFNKRYAIHVITNQH